MVADRNHSSAWDGHVGSGPKMQKQAAACECKGEARAAILSKRSILC